MENLDPPIVPDLVLSYGHRQNTNGMAIVSLLLGLAGIPLLCLLFFVGPLCSCPSMLPGIAAVITGFMARNQIKTSGETGNGVALAGMIIGGTQVVLLICSIVISVVALAIVYMIGSFSGANPGLK